MPKLKRKSALPSREAAIALRGTSRRSTRSSRRRASRARWSSSPLGTLTFDSFIFAMAPSASDPPSTIVGAVPLKYCDGGANACELRHSSANYSEVRSAARTLCVAIRRETEKAQRLQRQAAEQAREVAGDTHRVAHQKALDRRQAVDDDEPSGICETTAGQSARNLDEAKRNARRTGQSYRRRQLLQSLS